MNVLADAVRAIAPVAVALAALGAVAVRFLPLRRTLRAKLNHAFMYALFVALVVWVGSVLDWAMLKDNFLREGWQENISPLVMTGAVNTIKYTIIAFAGGLVLAIALALMKLSSIGVYRWVATGYIEFFRGLPALTVIILMALGMPLALGWMPPGGTIGAGLIGLILVSGAYMAETLRAGIQAVPKGQNEAARSLGMTGGKTMTFIVMPQAMRIVIPPLTNELVLIIKDTALLSTAGAMAQQRELTQMARDFMSSGPTAGTATSLIMAAMLYLIITLPMTRLVAWLEKKQQRAR